MAKFTPPLFARLYLGIIIAIVSSIVLTLYVSDESITKSDMTNFNADTSYIFDEISRSLAVNDVEPESYIQSLPKNLLAFNIQWQPVWDGAPQCESCEHLYTIDNNMIYEDENEVLLAAYPVPNTTGAILISDQNLDINMVEMTNDEELNDKEFNDDAHIENLASLWQQHPEDLLPLILLFVALLAISAPLYFPIRQLQKQINQLIDTNKRFGRGELMVRASTKLSKPVSSLATSFNQMAESITETVKENQIFAQAVPHEMRTPLSRIQLATGLLRKSNTEPQQIALLNNIDSYIDDIDELTKQVLTFSKLNAAPSKDNAKSNQVINLEAYFDERITQLNQEQTKQVILYCHQQALKCDPAYLRLMFDNLVKNAIRYAKSTVIISVETKSYSGAYTQLIITVDDDGPGIASEDVDTIFMPFSRLDKSRNQQTGGLGLGLAIAKAASKRMSGELTVSRNPEGGASFCCKLNEY